MRKSAALGLYSDDLYNIINNMITRNKNGDFVMNCCNKPKMLMVEYGYPHPEQYDGVSEYTCSNCGYRQGRWSGKELVGKDYELRYGREK